MRHHANGAILAEIAAEYWRQPQGKWKYFEYVGLTMTILEELPAPDASQLF